jgi:hypothetical protein
MVPRRGILGHVIYDDAVRRSICLCLGALAFCLVSVGLDARAQEVPDPGDPAVSTTTAPPTSAPPTSTTAKPTTTSTTAKASPSTTTSVTRSGAPVPPPPSGPSQTRVPDLVGSPVDVSTTTGPTAPFAPTTAVPRTAARATNIAAQTDSPSGLTLILATIAWLASLGGLLVYAEDRRSARWKHLAR